MVQLTFYGTSLHLFFCLSQLTHKCQAFAVFTGDGPRPGEGQTNTPTLSERRRQKWCINSRRLQGEILLIQAMRCSTEHNISRSISSRHSEWPTSVSPFWKSNAAFLVILLICIYPISTADLHFPSGKSLHLCLSVSVDTLANVCQKWTQSEKFWHNQTTVDTIGQKWTQLDKWTHSDKNAWFEMASTPQVTVSFSRFLC